MIPTYGSLFAGVGGFDLGLDAAGYECRFQVEYDKNCQQVLNRRWPTVPKWGDIRGVSGAELPPVDLLTFGSPCQDLSVAGKRAGLAGERSGLFHEAMRIVKEMRNATANQYPRIVVWENVVGALSSNGGRDFGTVLHEMAEIGSLVTEWSVLDAQHFGVAQRRRRLFVVAVLDPVAAERCPDPLLPVGESVRRNTQARGTARETAAGTPTDRVGTLSTADLTKGQMGHEAINANLLQVVYGITGHAIGRSDTAGPNGPSHTPEGGPMFTLTSTDRHAVLIDGRRIGDVRVYAPPVQTLEARMGTGGNNTPMLLQVLAFDTQFGSNANVFVDQSPTLKATQQSPSVAAFDEYNGTVNDETHQSLRAGTKQSNGVVTESAVRRLTPVECERLMGWPDDHTLLRADGKEQSDAQRYRQIGNGVASPVAKWIGKHLCPLLA